MLKLRTLTPRLNKSGLPALVLSGLALSFAPIAPAFANDESPANQSVADLTIEKLADLRQPWGMQPLPDGRLLITEKPGALRIYANGALSEPVAGLPAIEYNAQGGLLDVAIDPDFARNGLVYLYFVQREAIQPANPVVKGDPRLGPFVDPTDTVAKRGVVWRARLDGNRLRDGRIVWQQSEAVVGLNHFGGRLIFMPDNTLVITSGDRQIFEPAQDNNSTLGKIIRINSDGSIPRDNPYADRPAPLNSVLSIGHRNPLGVALHPETGKLWINEMGPLYGDEINIIEGGRNYGWPAVNNGENYDFSEIAHHEVRRGEFIEPIFYWRPAISPSGMAFYTDDLFAGWKGNLLVGGLGSQTLIRLTLDGERVIGEDRYELGVRVRDVHAADDGSVLILTDAEDGALLRLTPAG